MKIKALFFLICGLVLSSCNSQTDTAVQTVSTTEFGDKMKSTSGAQLLDVRTPEEYAGGHLNNSANIDWNGGNFESGVAKLDKNQPVFVYCRSGGRSLKAANKLKDMGFTQIYDLDGGIVEWESAGLPLAPTQKH